MSTEKKPLEKVCLICAKGSLEDVYASLVMANGAVMEGIETNVFFTFFGLDGITNFFFQAEDGIRDTNS